MIPFLAHGATILMVVLKILGYISASWWLVLAPSLVILVIQLLFIGLFLLVFKRFVG